MPGETLTERRPGAEAQPGLAAVREPAACLDLRGLTITTAIAFAVPEALAGVAVGDEAELLVDRFEALMPDLEAWCRATGHELSGISQEGETLRLRVRKGEPYRTEQRVAIVVSSDGLEELLSPLARAGLEKAGHVAATTRPRQLQELGGRLYACGPSLAHFDVDPNRLAFDDVVVCEYLGFMEVMRQADVQLYC